MKACEIFHVSSKKSYRWKWRHVDQNGRVSESQHSYDLYYECVKAARDAGYEPRNVLKPGSERVALYA
jgi:adenosine deaminase